MRCHRSRTSLCLPCHTMTVTLSCCTCKTAPALLTFFFFNDTATTEIYTLSLHDALPISRDNRVNDAQAGTLEREHLELSVDRHVFHQQNSELPCHKPVLGRLNDASIQCCRARSEEHTSELQSLTNLVCRLLLEKKKKWILSWDEMRLRLAGCVCLWLVLVVTARSCPPDWMAW